MSITYSELIADVQAWLQRSDDAVLQAALPYCVNLAIERITNDSTILGGVTYVTGNLTAGNPVLFKPYSWRDNMSFYVGTGANFTKRVPVLLRSYDVLINYWPDDTVNSPQPYNSTTPIFIADYDYSTWKIAPTPDQNYPFEISYYNQYAPLDINNQTNWLTQYADNVLFYATMTEAYFFLQDWENFEKSKAEYRDLLRSIIEKDQSRQVDRYTNRGKD